MGKIKSYILGLWLTIVLHTVIGVRSKGFTWLMVAVALFSLWVVGIELMLKNWHDGGLTFIIVIVYCIGVYNYIRCYDFLGDYAIPVSPKVDGLGLTATKDGGDSR